MKAHVFWDQMWTHIYVGRLMVAENVHQVLTVDTHLCLRSKVATHVHVCIGDQHGESMGVGNVYNLYWESMAAMHICRG